MQEVRIQSLGRELKSHMPHGQNIKQKQHSNKLDKDNGSEISYKK